jgi:hypothetical protein
LLLLEDLMSRICMQRISKASERKKGPSVGKDETL